MTDNELADFIDHAADMVDAGWIQGRFYRRSDSDGTVGYCLAGALHYAAEQQHCESEGFDGYLSTAIERVKLVKRASEVLVSNVDLPDPVDGEDATERLIAWNDTKGRTQSEVADLLRRTAKGLRP